MKVHSNIFGVLILLITLSIFSCKNETKLPEEKNTTAFNEPPQWAQEAVWYQLFVERFRNGDKSNDPTLETVKGSWLEPYPDDWSPTDWGFNWYAQEEWAENADLEFYSSIQMRRYGGDLQGVLDKVEYIKELGVTAIYFNPINDAPSLHKFDARCYRHVDVTFGPDRDGDIAIIANEDPSDPATWQMTSADKLFFELVEKLHQEGIKVIVDFSWNHTGSTFWAFRDVVENQTASKYKDWYEITTFDDPSTTENEFEYEGWLGVATLPDIKKIRKTKKRPGHPYEGNMYPEPKAHIFNVAKKYMDPNGDGDVSDGIDGMRLDVAEHVPMGFWRDFRKHVRGINPDFYLVGENWWTSWPDSLMDPKPWVKGDIFDAVMHYQWYKPVRHYFHTPEENQNPAKFKKSMDSVFLHYPEYTQRSMMNMSASHDSPRLATSMSNRNKYKYDASARGNSKYNEGPVTDKDYELIKLFLLNQFTWVGSPQIWMGDEMGMFGGDDPDNRKPLMWDDVDFDAETNSSFSDIKYKYKLQPRKDIAALISELAQLRKDHPALIYGDYKFEETGTKVIKYTRTIGDKMATVYLNPAQTPQKLELTTSIETKNVMKVGEYVDGMLGGYSGIVHWNDF